MWGQVGDKVATQRREMVGRGRIKRGIKWERPPSNPISIALYMKTLYNNVKGYFYLVGCEHIFSYPLHKFVKGYFYLGGVCLFGTSEYVIK